MLIHKSIEKICGIVAFVCVLIAVLFMNSDQLGITQAESTNTYEEKLFSELSVHEINIVIDDDQWNSMLDNASEKEYIACDLYIDGERFTNIAIRTKGNSSLQQVQSSDSDRYSFKIEFDHYDNTTTYYGLDKFCLNNIVQDTTYMKDYIAYDLMNEFGVASPLTNYVNVSVNGELFGLYLAVEAIEESFLQRNYGTDYGILYKPETSSNVGGGGGGGDERTAMPEQQAPTEMEMSDMVPDQQAGGMGGGPGAGMTGGQAGGGMGGGPGGGMAGGQPGGDRTMPEQTGETSGTQNRTTTTSATSTLSSALSYVDDDPDSYSYIFDNAVSNISNTDKSRLIASLKQLDEQVDLEEVVDVEQVIRYFIVHNFLLNFDSYTGSIMHNYYMYEEDGVLSMLPWDYNLSFVAFMTSYSTEELINFPIDTPVSASTVEARAMLTWIFENEEYTELYHTLFAEFITELFDSGYFSNKITEVKTLLDEYVENDPSKFYTYEEFILGTETLETFVELRVESIKGQLDGTIGSTAEEQLSNPNVIVAGDLDVTNTGTNEVRTHGSVGMSPTRNNRQQGGQMPTEGEAQMPQQQSGQMPTEGEAQMPQQQGGQMPMEGEAQMPQQQGGQMQMGRQDQGMVATSNLDSSNTNNMLMLGGCFIAMIVGIVAVVYFKRRKW